MGLAHFMPNNIQVHNHIANLCNMEKNKPGIELLITHDFFTNEDILLFLSSNDMNIFMYNTPDRIGISSVIDYALSVKKPLGISGSRMLRHIYDDSICLNCNSIENIRKISVEVCDKFRDLWSNDKLVTHIEKIIDLNTE